MMATASVIINSVMPRARDTTGPVNHRRPPRQRWRGGNRTEYIERYMFGHSQYIQRHISGTAALS